MALIRKDNSKTRYSSYSDIDKQMEMCLSRVEETPTKTLKWVGGGGVPGWVPELIKPMTLAQVTISL